MTDQPSKPAGGKRSDVLDRRHVQEMPSVAATGDEQQSGSLNPDQSRRAGTALQDRRTIGGTAHGNSPAESLPTSLSPIATDFCGAGGVPVFRAEGVTLFRADSREIRELLVGDALVSDPPYGMDWNPETTRFSGGNNPRQRSAGRNDRGKVMHDDEPFDPSPWIDFPHVVLFGFHHFATRLPVGTVLVWIKRLDGAFGSFLSDAELAWMKGGHGVYCKRDLSMNGETATRIHPTQKPVALMAWCMDRAKVPAGATVVDPFTGSGSTAIACIRTGRKFIGAEKDAEHWGAAVARIQRELSQPEFLAGGGGGFKTVASKRATTATDDLPIVWPVALGAVPPVGVRLTDRGSSAD